MTSTVNLAIETLARGLVAFGAVSDDVDSAGALLHALGWSLPPGVDDIGLTKLDFATLAARLNDLDTLLEQANPSDVDLVAAYAAVAVALAASLQAIDQVGNGLTLDTAYGNATGLPGAFFTRGLNLFLIRAIGTLSGGAVALGTLFGFFEFIHYPDDPTIFQVEHIRANIRWDRIGKLFTDPAALLKDVYGWGTPTFLANALLMNLGRVVEYFAAEARIVALPPVAEQMLTGQPTPPASAGNFPAQLFVSLDKGAGIGAYDVGVSMFPLRPTTSGGTDAGVGLAPYAFGTAQASFDLSETLSLQLSGSDTIQGGVAVLLRAGSGPALRTGLLNAAAAGASSAAFKLLLRTKGAADARKVLFTGPNIVVDAKALSAGVGIDPGGTLNPTLALNIEDGRVVLTPDSSDGFLGKIIPDGGITIGLNLSATWSRQDGFRLQGGGGLSTSIALQQTIGPLALQSLSLAINATTTALTASAGLTASASIGPVTVMVDTVGATIALQFNRGNLGPVDLSTAFLPPKGVGVSVDAGGVVAGSGFLFHDVAHGTYAGALQVTLHGTLTLTALGLIATRMPDGSRGFSLLVFITAEDFQPIQLGLGFTLQAIGGLVAINRTFDTAVLRAGLKDDTLKTLLFPKDPVANATAIVQALERTFPAQRGSYLVGLLARITWFTPTLIQLDLGLVLELGARTRLLVLGRVSALLPSADNDLVRLLLDVVGELDFDAGTLAVDAVLVDSRLAHRFPITGAAAVRAHWGQQAGATGPDFVLAIGGFNPRFAVPAGFPSLERVAIALSQGQNPRLVCEAYLAITSNTLQFGARASLYAEAIGFSLTGDVGFDALISWSPLHFVADVHGMVQLKRGSHNLFKLSLNATLEGPQPLRLSGKVTFEIICVSFTVRFDATLSSGAAPAGLTAVVVENELRAALGAVANWSTLPAPGTTHGVALRAPAGGAGPVLDPLGQLVVKQQVVPLNVARDVDTYGGAPVAGARRFGLSGQLNAAAGTAVQGAFAPARYFTMGDDAKLAAPSYDVMDAGLVLGDATVRYATGDGAIVPSTLDYEPITLNPPTAVSAPVDPTARYTLPATQLQAQAATGAAARAPARQAGRARFRNAAVAPAATVNAPTWHIVRASDGAAAPVDPSLRTWSEQRAALDTLNRGGAVWVMVPNHELVA